ncbi:hypothetical protein B0H14DRAFT_2863965 [Mycena olivaceomarginata]|nr:hypothetical protein B0H14DRAFT_2863965 [Mycena olivaceomarginata]
MPATFSFPAGALRHITDHLCGVATCRNTKLKGSPLRLCSQCMAIYYCSTRCQRKDWPQHKSFCQQQVSRRHVECLELTEAYSAWREAIGPLPYTWLCVHALTVYRHPENIHSKFVLLTLRRRSEKETSVLNAFAYEQVQVFDRHDLDSIVEGDAAELLDHIRKNDQQAKRHGLAGAALLVVKIKQTSETTEAANHHIVRAVPVILIEERTHTEEEEWEEMIKDVINKGTKMKHKIARKAEARRTL